VLSNSIQQLLLVITNGRREVHTRRLTSVCKDSINTYLTHIETSSTLTDDV